MSTFPFIPNPLKTLLALALLLATTRALALDPPRISSPEPEASFGEVRSGKTIRHTFTLQNTGGGILNIHRTRASCGCTAQKLTSREILPGESASLTAEVDLTGRSGPQVQRITVHSNDPQTPRYTLTLTGEAIPRVHVSPRTLNFQQINPKSPPTGVIHVEATTDAPLRILEITSRRSWLDTRIETLEEEKSYKIHLTPTHGEEQGNFSDILDIRTEDDGEEDLVRVITMWQIASPVNLSPPRLNLLVAKDPQPINRFIMVRAGQDLDHDLRVTNVSWPGRDDVDIILRDTGNFGWRIELRNLTPDISMPNEEIQILTNVPGFETLSVPIRALRQ